MHLVKCPGNPGNPVVTRRAFAGGALAAMGAALAGCFGSGNVVKHIKVIAKAEVDGKPVEGTSVMEITWRPSGDRMYSDVLGEAVVLELAGRGTVYVLPAVYLKDGMISTYGIWALQVQYAIGVFGGLNKKRLPEIAALQGRFKFHEEVDGTPFPLMVAFKDENEFRSVYRVEPEKFGQYFGAGVRFIGVEFEITEEPVTKVLAERLPVLSKKENAVPDSEFRNPDGTRIAFVDKPFKYKIGQKTFFAPGRY